MIVKPFVLAFIATAGFAVLFNIEQKKPWSPLLAAPSPGWFMRPSIL